jgi:hypothetical protein
MLLLGDNIEVSSSAGTVINNVFGNSPSGSPNWGDTNAVWGQFRVLGFRVMFRPYNRYSKSITGCVSLTVTIDRRNASAYTSYDQADTHESCKDRGVEDPWQLDVKMEGPFESLFQEVAAPASTAWIKLYGTGFAVSTAYGRAWIYYLVQFRNVE